MEHVYNKLFGVLEGITKEELSWQPIPEMNTAGKILRHIARISLILLPQVVEGRTRREWDDDYEQEEHSLFDMLRDLETSKVGVLEGLRVLDESDFEKEIPLWGAKHSKAEGVNMLVGELLYHAGQIALLRGTYRRAKQA